MAEFGDFLKLDIRVGTIVTAQLFDKARKPAYQLTIDFGNEVGLRRSSAQIVDHYTPEQLLGKQVLAVINMPSKQVANFISEVLVLGTYSTGGVVLIAPERPVQNGDRLG